MAIFRLEVKTVSRAKGRSATAAIAYRCGERIKDERTGQIYDYRRKRGVEYKELIFPSEVKSRSRSEIWNQAEQAERRRDGVVAREYQLALPSELSSESRKNLALVFGKILTNRYNVVADIAIHKPHPQGDERNFHAHLLTTSRQVKNDGLAEKTRILDDKISGPKEVESLRRIWATLINDAFDKNGIAERVDHRSYQEQCIDKLPAIHQGPAVTSMERRGEETEIGNLNREIAKFNLSQSQDLEAERAARAQAWAQKKIQDAIDDRRRQFEEEISLDQLEQQQETEHHQLGGHHV